jgi:hypothetical protein
MASAMDAALQKNNHNQQLNTARLHTNKLNDSIAKFKGKSKNLLGIQLVYECEIQFKQCLQGQRWA